MSGPAPSPARTFCLYPGCRVAGPSRYCRVHTVALGQSTTTARRWYHSARWRRLRASVLMRQPLCLECLARDHVRLATEVDHIEPHRGQASRFWDRSNVQGLCIACHGRKTLSGR